MSRRAYLTAFLALVLAGPLPAQEPPAKAPPKKDKAEDEYPNYFGKPETPADFWNAMKYEIEVGEFEIAARFLQGLLDKKPTKAEWLALEEKDGMSSFLRLRGVQQWSRDPAKNAQAKKNVDQLIQEVTTVLKEHIESPERIAKFVKNLTATPEEQEYAMRELYRAGPVVVPALVEALRKAEGEDRLALLHALTKLGPSVVPPLMAALDSGETGLVIDVIGVLERRGEKLAVPFLWFLSASPRQPPEIRSAATHALTVLLNTESDRLPPARLALTKEAERFYYHQEKFLDPTAVAIWRWDAQSDPHIVQGWPDAPTVTGSQAEEYYGLRFARQALELDPAYEPAQIVLLSLALDKAVERVGLDTPLGRADKEADVNRLLTTVNPGLVVVLLDKALNDKRLNVILASVRALGDLAEPRAMRPLGQGESPMARALNYPEARVQLAAAEGILRIPARPSPLVAVRVLEVLRRALAAEPEKGARARVMVGYENEMQALEIAGNVRRAGYDPVVVRSGREALKRLNQAADIDVLLLDAALPDPGLSGLLAQLRGDVHFGRLPLLLVSSPQRDEGLRRLTQQYREESKQLDLSKQRAAEFARQNQDVLVARAETESEQRQQAIDKLSRRYGAESLRADERLRRYVEQFPGVWVIPADWPLDSARLKGSLQQYVAQADSPPLGEAIRKDYAERSLAWLGRIARGEVDGYDIRSAPELGDTVLQALRSTTLSDRAVSAAVDVAARLPGSKPQRALATVLLSANRAIPLRIQAADELVRHIQRNSLVLAQAEIDALVQLSTTTTEKALKPHAELVVGSLRPDPRESGERLRDYKPALPAKK